MEIIIDPKSGFCFGVEKAIRAAEENVTETNTLYCLGEIVHNDEEVNRLKKKGIIFITKDEFYTLDNCTVLLRAHGEPPEVYKYARQHRIELIDATCRIVSKVQEKVRKVRDSDVSAQIVIYGKKEHPETVGLLGQAGNALVIESFDEIDKVDFSKEIYLFAQTTKDKQKYNDLKVMLTERLEQNGLPADKLIVTNSICGQVSNRAPWLEEFSKTVDALIFVGGRMSSNSKVLFDVCKRNNPRSFFITTVEELDYSKLEGAQRIGICGATSTPRWLMQQVADALKETVEGAVIVK